MKTLRGGALLVILRRSHTAGMQSKVHPTYKTKYRVANWAAYNQALVRRGDVTVWVSSEAIAAWTPGRSGQRTAPCLLSRGRLRGRPMIRTSVPERVAMFLTCHKSRAIFDRYNIINEQELLEAGDQLVASLALHARATPRGRRPHPAGTAVPRTTPPLRLVRRTTA